jgi:hypothetical protein
MSKELSIQTTAASPAFADQQGFELAQRIAKALSASDLVPTAYKGNVSNCLVALEYSHRVNMSVLAVMQNLHIIHGKPSPSAAFIIAAINTCGRFAPLKYRLSGEGDQARCVAWTTDASGEVLESPPATIEMAKKEGWYARTGSKWQSMPELMLRYRAAAFFGRLYAPEIIMGMHSAEEVADMQIQPANTAINALREVGKEAAKTNETIQDVDIIEVVE